MRKRMLLRPWKGRMLCGVCAGLAAYFDVDVRIVRALWAAACLMKGVGLFAYVMASLLLPEEIRCWSAEEGYYEDYC